MDELDKLVAALEEKTKTQVPVQTVWVTVSSVDWDAKTMECKGLVDDLEYFDVLLGLKGHYKKPKKDTKCIIGITANDEAAAHLIHAEEVEEFIWEDSTGFQVRLNQGEMTMNGDNKGALIVIQNLVNKINAIEDDLNTAKAVFTAWSPVSQDGGAALKSAMVVPGGWASSLFTSTTVNDLKNDKVKHGG